MKLMRKKGFTLVEVLIVVVIIGILAALVLPRMIQQPERARVAEANQMLGVLRRAQINMMDTSNSSISKLVDTTTATWSALGLTMPATANASFSYTCTATSAGSCTANRTGDTSRVVSIDINAGTFGCTGYSSAANPGAGCL